MIYKVVPIDFDFKAGANSKNVAVRLQKYLRSYASKGWEFQSLETVQVFVGRPWWAFWRRGVELELHQIVFKSEGNHQE